MPKRKFEEVEPATGRDPSTTPPLPETDESSNLSCVTDSSVDVPSGFDGPPKPKQPKKSVHFDKVTVFYFPRTQGFMCVPSEGGSTLGMSGKHIYTEDFSLPGYAREQKRIHKILLKEHQQNGKLIPASRPRPLENDSESDDDDDDSESDVDVDEYYFLQPVPIRQRRIMLRAAGIRKIDSCEKDECREIRQSREICGCECKVFCDPETCSCSLAGIRCQVDRLSFPCGCSKDGCGNVAGRIEFNPIRVRTHFIHTLMRIELERKDKECFFKRETAPNLNSIGYPVEPIAVKQQSIIDLADFNSNERGSCRDCQNSEVCNVMMQEVQYAVMEDQQSVTTYTQPPPLDITVQTTNGRIESLPRVFLFSDSDDEIYNSENTSLYGFKQEDSSYSETSDCSSESSSNFDNSDYTKSYQNLSAFDEETNQEYCDSTPNSCQQLHSNGQIQQKYIELNSSSPVYKLEPVSHLVNPIENSRFACTPPAQTADIQTTSWSGDSSHCTSQSSFIDELPASTYTIMTDTTTDQLAENCPAISSHMNSYKRVLGTIGEGTIEGAGMQEDTDSQNLMSSTYDDYQLDKSHSAAAASGMTSSDQPLISLFPSKSELISSPAHSSSQELLLEHRSSSAFQDNSCSSSDVKETCYQRGGAVGQDFGEIIKESIVETVSA